ncbi:hypothetical protein K435DRAFT_803201 [Dendrothele bispora CBS 962.96]|uniref:Uncharacterized protein n=1 Tax=Dendrothele bispora (strain CBS 962.96) TaxID=1314807 RepID=A0A4V4HDW1_DENBC|nr:hypothetical protein K435DRAFT_803201 [Dendrothele bispora CBS 962.96]
MVVDLIEEDKGALNAWSDAKEMLSNISDSDSESVYKGASSQLQTIPFPISSAKQRLNWTTPAILDESDLGGFEGDFVGGLIPASQTLVIKGYTPFVGFVPTVSIWMINVNKQWKKIGVVIIVGSATDIRSRSSTYNSENVMLPSKY